MPQIKNADGFLHQRFCVPFTRCQALPALQRLTRPKGFTRPQDLTRALAPYTQLAALHGACCFTRPQDLER